jgi:predicted permease
MSTSGRRFEDSPLIHLALLAFPSAERQRYGRALVETWSDLAADRPSRWTLPKAAWDLFHNGWRLRLEVMTSPRGRPQAPTPRKVDPSRRRGRSGALDSLARNQRLALRRLRREPGFAIVAVLLLALGIGATTTIFSAVNGILFKPLPYDRPEEMVRIYMQKAESGRPEGVSYPEFEELTAHDDLFAETAFHADITFLTVEDKGRARTVIAESFSAGLLHLLGLKPSLGRGFSAEEGTPGGSEPVAILGHGAWRSHFGADPQVLGSHILVNGLPVTVVGVGPENFKGTIIGFESEIYLSWGTAAAVDRLAREMIQDRSTRDLFMLARLQPGVSLEAAQSAMTTVAAGMELDHPEANEDQTLVVFAARDVRSHPLLDRALIPLSVFLLVVVGLVMTVAVSNLANLLLAKASARKGEMALRTALGARRRELIGQLLMESMMLALVGGALGSLIAVSAPRWLESFQGPIPVPITLDMHLDWRVLAFALVLTLGTGLLLGIAPALSSSRSGLRSKINGAPPRLFGRRLRVRPRDTLIVLQVAVSTLLLVGGGLFLRSLLLAQNTDPGFQVAGVAVASFDVAQGGFHTEESGRRFIERYVDQLESTPSVEAIAVTDRVPFGLMAGRRVGVSQHALGAGERPEQEVELSIVSSSYWGVLDIPLLRGRLFRTSDDEGAAQVGVVSEAMAQAVWGHREVVGESLEVMDKGRVEIIGVVADTKLRRLNEEPPSHLYLSMAQHYEPAVALLVKSPSPGAMKETLRRELEILDPRVPLFENKTLEEFLGARLYPARLAGSLLIAAGFLALLLASCGLYGVIAFAIVQRTREVGIRTALGATRAQLVAMVVGEAFRLVALGLLAGLALATLVTRPLRSLLYGLSPFDPSTFAVVALVLGAVTAVACWLSARKAAGVDVVAALKAD